MSKHSGKGFKMKISFEFLKQSYPLNKAFFVVPKRLLLYIGLWPFSPMDLFHISFSIFNSVSLAIGGFSEYAFVFTHLNEPLKALDCVCPASSVTVTFFKYVYLTLKRADYRESMNRCQELFFADKELDKDLKKK
uniref:Uncharacterized protein n=1 Tax=Megaselia scalaris TaxID=36166 RepID=T1GTP9_MEGSC